MTIRGNGPKSQRRPDYGQGYHQIETSEFMFSPQAMVAHLRQTLASPSYKPPLLPAIALDLMRLTRQPDVSLAEVRQLLERDPVLAAQVLQLAQSALYSRGVSIRSLHEAITRIGLRTLGDVFLQTVLSVRVFRANGYEQPMAELLRHSTLTAHIARATCRLTAIPDEYAFMCGLLHDVGMAAGLLIFADPNATRWPGPNGRAERPEFDAVATALEAVHEEASAILAHAWRLHPEVALVLGHHHRPRIGGRVHPLAAVVCVADWIASSLGVAIGNEVNSEQARAAADHLCIDDRHLRQLTEGGREILELL